MNINKLRSRIDGIDKKISKHFQKRMDYIKLISNYKIKNKLNIFDDKREKNLIDKISQTSKDKYKDYIKSLFKIIMEISKSYQSNCFLDFYYTETTNTFENLNPNHNIVSISFLIDDISSINDILTKFTLFDFKLIKITSNPTGSNYFNDRLTIDFIGNVYDNKTVCLLNQFKDETIDFELIDCYFKELQ